MRVEPSATQEKPASPKGGRVRAYLARMAIRNNGTVAKPVDVTEQAPPFEHPLFHKAGVDPTALATIEEGERKAALTETVRGKLTQLGIDEKEAVFRGLAHPAGNITPQVVCTYGTDRFEGYGRHNLPQSVEGLTPYRNRGQTGDLSADTYAVPSLSWAVGGFSELDGAAGLDNFATGHSEPFILVYDSKKVFTERTPGNQGGEQWRSTFLTEPREALLACIQLAPGTQTAAMSDNNKYAAPAQ
ncbi:MAG: hypothetical protein ABWY71_00240 [Candidatus Saccharimonadales bacterium]